MIATPEKAAAERADATELGAPVAELDQVQALPTAPGVPADLERELERIESNLEELYGKLGSQYPGTAP